MIIINRTTADMDYTVVYLVPAPATRASGTIHPNQTLVLKLTDQPPPNGVVLNVYEVQRVVRSDQGVAVETVTVPGDATIIFSTEVQTNLFGAD